MVYVIYEPPPNVHFSLFIHYRSLIIIMFMITKKPLNYIKSIVKKLSDGAFCIKNKKKL